MITIALTGRIRHRTQRRLFRTPVQVLQIEELHKGTVGDGLHFIVEVEERHWRDAVHADLRPLKQRSYLPS